MNVVLGLQPLRVKSLEVNRESDFHAPYSCQSSTPGTQLANMQVCPTRIAGGEERDAAGIFTHAVTRRGNRERHSRVGTA